MGSGKSTLVDFLSRTYGVVPFYEPNDDNPYLADFYKDMKRWAFQSQLYFLSNKFRLHQELDRHDIRGCRDFCDRAFPDAQNLGSRLADISKFLPIHT